MRHGTSARVLVRDAEWLVRRIDRISTGGQALSVVYISELGKIARFLRISKSANAWHSIHALRFSTEHRHSVHAHVKILALSSSADGFVGSEIVVLFCEKLSQNSSSFDVVRGDPYSFRRTWIALVHVS